MLKEKIGSFYLFMLLISFFVVIIETFNLVQDSATIFDLTCFLIAALVFLITLCIIFINRKRKINIDYSYFLIIIIIVNANLIFELNPIKLNIEPEIIQPLAINYLQEEYKNISFLEDFPYTDLYYGDNTIKDSSFRVIPSSDFQKVIVQRSIYGNIFIFVENKEGKIHISQLRYEEGNNLFFVNEK